MWRSQSASSFMEIFPEIAEEQSAWVEVQRYLESQTFSKVKIRGVRIRKARKIVEKDRYAHYNRRMCWWGMRSVYIRFLACRQETGPLQSCLMECYGWMDIFFVLRWIQTSES